MVSLAAQRFIAQVRPGFSRHRRCHLHALAQLLRALLALTCLICCGVLLQVLEEAHNTHKLRQMAPAAKLKEQVGAGGIATALVSLSSCVDTRPDSTYNQ